MIDTHCHLLPGIDDGSRSVEQSVSVLRQFGAEGVTDVVLTPHLAASHISLDGDGAVARRERAMAALAGAAPASPRLALGFEIMLDQPMPTLAMGDRRFSLAQSRYYLVEFPLGVVAQFAATVLQQMARAGVIPLVAHPERYDACSPATVAEWRRVGARIQVDATTLTRPTSRGRRARALLAAGAVDLVAADNHGDGRTVATAARFLAPHSSAYQIEHLTRRNPAAILSDSAMTEVGPVTVRERLIDRIAGIIRGG